MLSPATETQEFEATRAAHGVRAAGEWLVRRHASDVYGLCLAIVRDRATAEDLTQESFGRALASLASYRGDASPRTWLLTIARHRCIDHLRARKRERSLFLADEPDEQPSDLPHTLDRLASSEQLRAALGVLDEADRSLVVLRFGHGFEYPELASVFGAREATIRMRLSRALARMRDAIASDAPSSFPQTAEALSPSAPGSYGGPPAPASSPPAAPSPIAASARPMSSAPPPPSGPPTSAPPPPSERPRRTSDRLASLARFVGDIFRAPSSQDESTRSATPALFEKAPSELVDRLLATAASR